METYTTTELRNNLAEITRKIMSGETISVTRNGEEFGRFGPPPENERKVYRTFDLPSHLAKQIEGKEFNEEEFRAIPIPSFRGVE
jgi:antitoxin (DNA-binding transcriptional repressor) of toxin-antitoxin stability system